jgi:hypothetical protein
MLSIAGRATSKLQELLASPNGLNASLAALAQSELVTVPPIPPTNLFTDNVSSDIAEKASSLNTLQFTFTVTRWQIH